MAGKPNGKRAEGTQAAKTRQARTTDLEVELVAKATVNVQQAGEITLPGRKLLDIVKALPDSAQVTVSVEGERATVRSGKSRFTLATLPAAEFAADRHEHVRLHWR